MRLDVSETGCCASEKTSNSCSVPIDGQQGCNCAPQATQAKVAALSEKAFSIEETRLVGQRYAAALKMQPAQIIAGNKGGLRRNMRGGMMLGIACVTSPCCTPLIVPLVLGLLAGTPAALWLTQNIGWFYGGLTLVSFMSLVLGLRWVWQKLTPQTATQPESKAQEITPESSVYSSTMGIPDSSTASITRN